MRRSIYICIIILACSSGTLFSADWPRYRGDAVRSGTSEETLEFPLHLQWVYRPDRAPRPAWPDPVFEPHRMQFDYAPVAVVADGLLYFGSTTDDSVHALDAKSGEPVWRFTTGGPVRFAPDITDGRAYVGSDDGYIYCLDARTGELAWRFRAFRTGEMVLGNERMISRRPLRGGVLVDDGIVYATAGMWPAEGVIVYALDARSGDVIWTNDTTMRYMAQPHGGYALTGPTPQGYLALGNDVLLVPSGRSVPAGFDRKDGSLLYYDQSTDTDRRHKRGGSWLCVDATADLYVNMVSRAFRLSTGEKADGRGTRYVRQGAVRAGEVLIQGGDGRVTAEDVDWSAEVEGRARRLAVADGRLYVSTDAGRIYCFASGESAAGTTPSIVRPPAAEADIEPGPLAREALALLGERRLNRGYALVLGEPEPDLAPALAAATELHVLQVFGSEEAARAARERLLGSTHLYGSRLAVIHTPDGGGLPLSPYFANIIVGGPETLDVPADDIHHVLRPAGGLWLPGPGSAPLDGLDLHRVQREDSQHGLVLERGKLPGAFDWDSETRADERVRWPLALSWFGGPGPARVMESHSRAPAPVAANGRYFQIGHHYITAVDAYNGTEIWCRYVPFAAITRRGGKGATIQSLSADDEHVYLNVGSVVYRLDAQTGRQRGIYGAFDESKRHALDGPRRFDFDVQGRVTTQGGTLSLTPVEDGLQIEMETQDKKVSGMNHWELYFDFRPPERRGDLYEYGDLDVFRVIVDVRSGRPLLGEIVPNPYKKLSYARDTSGIVAKPDAIDPVIHLGMTFEGGVVDGGTKVRVLLPWADLPAAAGGPPAEFAFTATLMSKGKNVVRTHPFGTDNRAGMFNNGWPVFVLDADAAGEPSAPEVGSLDELPERALKWGRSPGSRWGQEVDAPAAFTGVTRTVESKKFGVNSRFYYKSKGCGLISKSAGMDVFRSATLAFYDIDDASGIHHFGGVRPGCGDAGMSAFGLLIQPEQSSGCTCSHNFQSSLALAPTDRRRNEDWAVYFEPVELGRRINRTGVNLGAVGDRRDEEGRLWIGYPRDLRVQAGEALALPLTMKRDETRDSLRINTDFTEVAGTDRPWIYGSCMQGLKHIGVDLAFHNPQRSAISMPDTHPPKVDGVLNDPLWDGSRRIALPDKASLQLRHDDEYLYIAYERPALIDRRGHRTPWQRASEGQDMPVWKEDRIGLQFASARAGEWGDFVRYMVTASGKQYSSHWPSTVDVPRIEGLTPDGKTEAWAEQGFRARVAAGVESRFAWDERGLWILTTLREDAMTDADMPTHFTFLVSSTTELHSNRMELGINLKKGTWHKKQDVIKVGESRQDGVHVIEALVPIANLGIEPGSGVEILLPMVYKKPGVRGRAVNNNFFRKRMWSGTVTRLRLAEQASAPRSVGFSHVDGRRLAFFAVDEKPFETPWTSAVRLSDESFTAEMAIPWSAIERFGFERGALRVSFDPAPTPDDNAEALQRFKDRGRTLDLDDAPQETRRYTIRLHFAELDEEVGPGERVFDVSLQGKTVLKDFDVVAEAGGHRRALVKEFRGVEASRNLEFTFTTQAGKKTQSSAPILNGLEIEEEAPPE